MGTSYQVKAGQPKPKTPTPYRRESSAELLARRLREAGKNAYVYQCDDCTFIVDIPQWNIYATNRAYGATDKRRINAWHVGIDTGAPHHDNRRSHRIPTYGWDDGAQDWLPQ